MPRVAVLNNFADTEAAKGFAEYTGEIPPKGVYRFKVKQWKLVESSAGDQMFRVILEITEPKKSKNAKYNGYTIFHNGVLAEKSAPFVNAMLDAFEIPRKAVWVKGGAINVSKDDDELVVSIGKKKVTGLEIMASTKRRKYEDEWQLNISQFLGAPEDESDDDDDDDDDEDDSDDSDSDDDDDDDEIPDDDDDDEDEPAPVKSKKSKAKATVAKAKKSKAKSDDDDDEDDEDDESF